MLYQITINPPTDIPSGILHFLTALLLVLSLWFWLRRELTPRKFLSIWETNGVLSARQILAWTIACYGMYMRYLGNLDNDGLSKCFEAAFILFGIGGVVNAIDKYKPAPTVNASTKGGDVNLDGPKVQNQPEAAPSGTE